MYIHEYKDIFLTKLNGFINKPDFRFRLNLHADVRPLYSLNICEELSINTTNNVYKHIKSLENIPVWKANQLH